MKQIIIQNEEACLKPCSTCSEYPSFTIPDSNYTDCWLSCSCGKKTTNTGGYNYGMEIPLSKAKRKAIKEWNEMNKY